MSWAASQSKRPQQSAASPKLNLPCMSAAQALLLSPSAGGMRCPLCYWPAMLLTPRGQWQEHYILLMA